MTKECKTALITGGLSGIGKAAVLEAAKKGYRIAIFDVTDNKAEDTIKACSELGAEAKYYHCDVTDPKCVEEAFEALKADFGGLDCAFNNVGVGPRNVRFEQYTPEEMMFAIKINLMGTMYCMKQELNIMKKQKYGRIVNNASAAGVTGAPGTSIYGAAKHGVVGLTKATALEYAADGITINAVAPGATHTELMDRMKAEQPELFAFSERVNPANRLAKPVEIANAVMFLFSDEAEFINGVTISVDSGYVAGPRVGIPADAD